MPLDNPRIEELRRRVQADPASIAFAQLAEEYRRAGSLAEAVDTCRLGLERHPTYLSARVTLGRALVDLDSLDEAQHELEFVLRAAPENLTALRGLAEIHHRRGHAADALELYQRARDLAPHDPELEQTIEALTRELGTVPVLPVVEPPPAASAAPDDAPSAQAADLVGTGAIQPEPASDATARLGAADEDLFDFEALLGALGEEPDRPAPSPVEALLNEPPGDLAAADSAAELAARALPEPATPSLPVEPADDPLTSLEQALRSHVPSPPSQVPVASPEPSPRQQEILEDLERLLDEIVVRREDPSDPS